MSEAVTACPPEIVVLLDHAMSHGLELAQYGTVLSQHTPTPLRLPSRCGTQAREGTDNADSVEVCWTVDVVRASRALLEWRSDESRWIGLELVVPVSGGRGNWTRFYEGPVLT